MKKLYVLLLLYLCFVPLTAQKNQLSKGAATITAAELRDHIFYLASDELEGRKTGTEGYNKAAQYVATQLRQAGLSPVCKNKDSTLSYYQKITIEKYSPGPNNTITIEKDTGRRTFSFENNFIISYNRHFEAKELRAGLVFAGYGISEPEYGIDDYKNVDIKGKWVVMLENLPVNLRQRIPQQMWQKYLYQPESSMLRVKAAQEQGALGIIFIPKSSDPDRWKALVSAYHDYNTLPGLDNPLFGFKLPVIFIDSVLTSYLFSGQKYDLFKNTKALKSFELRHCELLLNEEYSCSEIYTSNVVGLIEGSDPVLRKEFITLTAHLDHLGIQDGEVMNGADDNASGSAGVLEIAEALANSVPKRSILCVICSAEEQGLLGSAYFIENSLVPCDNIIANINLDMIGCSDTDIKALAPIGAGRITSKFKEVITRINDKTQNLPIDWAYADTSRYVNMSDHYPFHLKKIPSVFFFSGDNTDIHMPSDDAEKIDYDFLQKSCQLVYEIIMEMANGDVSLRD